MTLYELTNDYLALLAMADEDVDEEVLKDTMEGIEGELEDKADSYVTVIKELEAEAEKFKAEIDRLSARKKALENNAQRIKKNLEKAMIDTGKTKFKTEHFSYAIQKNAPSLKIDSDVNVLEIPDEYLVYSAPAIDKTKVKAAIKAGEEFNWARMEQSESIRIR